jgi:hypothetical protein
MEKECKKHGMTEFVFRSDNRWRCKKCAVDAVLRRREKIKKMAFEYKGGKCQNPECGYNRCMDALQFHHLESDDKDFGISSTGYTLKWETIKLELDKCIMLCGNCHPEVHAGLLDVSKF